MEPKPGQETVCLSWAETNKALAHLSSQLPPNAILWGIPRGGALIALLLTYVDPSKHFNVHRDLYAPIYAMHDGATVILLDDICDTGATFKKIIDHMCPTTRHQLVLASLIHRNGATVTPLFVGETIHHDKWIVFPWEHPAS